MAVGAEGAAQLATILQSTTEDDTIDGETKKRNLGAMNDPCVIKPRGLQRQVQCFRDVPTFIVVQSFQAMM